MHTTVSTSLKNIGLFIWFGEETPVLKDSFTTLLLWNFTEDLAFHF